MVVICEGLHQSEWMIDLDETGMDETGHIADVWSHLFMVEMRKCVLVRPVRR